MIISDLWFSTSSLEYFTVSLHSLNSRHLFAYCWGCTSGLSVASEMVEIFTLYMSPQFIISVTDSTPNYILTNHSQKSDARQSEPMTCTALKALMPSD